jgi:cellulose synthase/poly-beta-1,6-N-acetylglucosamine synthase-like glycosyltransferase
MIVALLWIATGCTSALLGFYAVIIFRYTHDLINQKGGGHAHRAGIPAFAVQPLSVIICARNEADNLRNYLPRVLQQQYCFTDGSPAFEVIVVNDGSDDDTSKILAELQEEYPHLRMVNIDRAAPRTFPGKKFPLSLGLAAAQHEWIVCTDADCAPGSLAWLHFMTAPFLEGKEIVAGYGGMILRKGWLNAFIRYETKHTFLQYFTFTRLGQPYMAVGRNLAAMKEKFLQAQSAPEWKALPSGDDDLLVQLCADGRNMAVVAHPGSFTWSMPKDTWREYLSQKRRHVSAGKFYSLKTKLLVGAYAFAHAVWWLLMLFFAFSFPQSGAQLLCLTVPMILLLAALQQGAGFLCERSRMPAWLAFSFCWVLYNAVLAPYILWKTKQRWA